MRADGSIIIDTKITADGIKKGFSQIKNNAASVVAEAQKVGDSLSKAFSSGNISKSVATATAKVKGLERQLAAITSDFTFATIDGDDKTAERLARQRIRVYDQLEAARERLAIAVADAAKKEADAEERQAQKATAAKARENEKQFKSATKSTRRFGNRLREIASGALVFNLISSGLRSMTQYFGAALKSNNAFSKSFAQLKGALLTAFQPIYEIVLPALLALMRVLTAVVQVIGQFFSLVSGKNYSQMAANAEALNKEASAIEGVGSAAKKAQKQLAGFDEINKLNANTATSGGGGGSGSIVPDFKPIEITDSLKHILYLVGAVGAALLTWKIASAFTNSLSMIAGLAMAVGGAVLYAFNVFDAFKNGIDWNNLSGMLLGMIAVAGGLYLAFGSVGAAVGLIITAVITAIAAIKDWIKTGELSNEACAAMVAAILAIGAAISLLTGGRIPALIAAIVAFAFACVTKADEMKAGLARLNDWLQNIFQKDFTELFGPVLGTIMNSFMSRWGGLWNGVTGVLTGVIDFIGGVLTGEWQQAWNGFLEIVKGIVDAIAGVVQGVINTVKNAINAVKKLKNEKKGVSGSSVNSAGYGGASGTFSARITTPEVPALARGAVIPPNAPFMAMLGDQRHGTNIEAPLSTIQEAVALVMEDYAAANLAGHEATVTVLRDILEAVLGIEIGDEVLSKAASRYSTRLATMRGDA